MWFLAFKRAKRDGGEYKDLATRIRNINARIASMAGQAINDIGRLNDTSVGRTCKEKYDKSYFMW